MPPALLHAGCDASFSAHVCSPRDMAIVMRKHPRDLDMTSYCLDNERQPTDVLCSCLSGRVRLGRRTRWGLTMGGSLEPGFSWEDPV